MEALVLWFQQLGKNDVEIVGGKNASLGEMISNLSNMGVSVPGGFATTAQAYRDFLEQSGLNKRIHDVLDTLNVDDVVRLAEVGKQIREWIVETPLQPALEQAIRDNFAQLANGNEHISVAVRSSATAEDLPDASFAGQQETFLNIRGVDNVLTAVKEVFARYLMTVPLLTVSIKVTSIKAWRCPLVFNAWCVQKQARQGCCLPWIPSLVFVMSSLSPVLMV